jgi:putative DNA primase/helicase
VAPVPERPTGDDVAAAVAVIDDLLQDFPFTSARADRAHAFALLLCPIVRDLIPGPTPLHLIESASPGSGKGLLAEVLLTAALGDDVGTMGAGGDDEEMRKRLTTALLTGQPAMVLDNAKIIDSPSLARALTSRVWTDRVLGASEQVDLPVRCAWVATANNPMLSTEIARRSIRIRIDPHMDQPWRRVAASFTHPELITYTRANRGRILAAALTIAQAWLAAGQPQVETPPLGSYEDWRRVIGGILAHAGIEGFLTNLDALYERADSEGAAWRRFVGAWWAMHGKKSVGVADLYPMVQAGAEVDLGDGTERSQKIKLGKMLKEKLDMVIGGFRIEKAADYQGAAQYRLRQTLTDGPAGECGECGECPSPPPTAQNKINKIPELGPDIHDIHDIHENEPEDAHPAPRCACGRPVTHHLDGVGYCERCKP